jgi:predicted ATPase
MKAMRRMLLVLVVATILVGATAAPAFAFIHAFIPAGQCATSEQAGDNETAEAHLPRVPIETPPAPDVCPAPQK